MRNDSTLNMHCYV